MFDIEAKQVTPRLASLFDPGMPAGLRCFAVLDGTAAGRIVTDDPADPIWGAVRDAGSSTLYLGGVLDAERVGRIVAKLRASGDVLIGMWPDDVRFALLPPDPEYDGWTLDFVDHDASASGSVDVVLGGVPPDCELRRMDRDLLARCAGRDYHAAIFGGAEHALRHGIGRCLIRGGEIVCEALAGPAALGMVELSVTTREADRGRGFATVTCAQLIRDCAEAGWRPYWNCEAERRLRRPRAQARLPSGQGVPAAGVVPSNRA